MSDFVAYLHEAFEQLGPIRARRMFGGYGLYRDELMFGVVMEDSLYLKADADTRRNFDERGLGPFVYRQGGKVIEMSYYLAPAEVLEDPAEAALWGRRACEAAARSQARKRARRGR